MLKKPRLLTCVLVALAGSQCTFLAANADTPGWQASSQLNQVQQALSQGLITPAQASDLMSRYNSIISKDQQWSMQDGGRLNTPDRLSLNGSLSRLTRRFQNDISNNGYNNGGLLNNLIGTNNLANPYGNGYTNAYGYGGGGCHHHRYNGIGSGLFNNGLNPINTAYNPYVSPVNYTSPYVSPVNYTNPYMNPYGTYNPGVASGLLRTLVGGGVSRF